MLSYLSKELRKVSVQRSKSVLIKGCGPLSLHGTTPQNGHLWHLPWAIWGYSDVGIVSAQHRFSREALCYVTFLYLEMHMC